MTGEIWSPNFVILRVELSMPLGVRHSENMLCAHDLHFAAREVEKWSKLRSDSDGLIGRHRCRMCVMLCWALRARPELPTPLRTPLWAIYHLICRCLSSLFSTHMHSFVSRVCVLLFFSFLLFIVCCLFAGYNHTQLVTLVQAALIESRVYAR